MRGVNHCGQVELKLVGDPLMDNTEYVSELLY